MVDVLFADPVFGTSAIYTPPGGGPAVPCAISRRVPDVALNVEAGRPVMQGDMLEVRKSELPAPAKGGTFTIEDSGEVLTVQGDPRCEDPYALIWLMTVR